MPRLSRLLGETPAESAVGQDTTTTTDHFDAVILDRIHRLLDEHVNDCFLHRGSRVLDRGQRSGFLGFSQLGHDGRLQA